MSGVLQNYRARCQVSGEGQEEEVPIYVELEVSMAALEALAAMWSLAHGQYNLTYIFLYSAPSLSCSYSIGPPSSTLLPWNALFAAKPPGQAPAMPLASNLPSSVCLSLSVPGPILTSMQYYSPQRHAELLEAPNYVWHLLLPVSGCPELYMQYVLEEVRRINF